jgi:hypothetical protein
MCTNKNVNIDISAHDAFLESYSKGHLQYVSDIYPR